jgi:hypothetical protein
MGLMLLRLSVWLALTALVVLTGAAPAPTPADCPVVALSGGTMPLDIKTPIGRGRMALIGLDGVPTRGTVCGQVASSAPVDTLRGDPGDVLHGDTQDDVLSGGPSGTRQGARQGRVIIRTP